MKIKIHIFHHSNLHEIEHKLDRILHLLEEIKKKEAHMSVELDALTVQVTENTDLERSAITLIEGIAALLAAAKDDPVKIAALAASLKASAESLSAAISANTPAA